MNANTAVLTGRDTFGMRGVSLVELMVAMALSLILLAGVLTIFASTKSTYETTDRLSRIQETGRFALDMIVRDMRSAGYSGCARDAAVVNTLNNADKLLWNFSRPVEGFDAQSGSWLPSTPDTGAVPAPTAGNDVLVVRRPVHDFEPVRTISPMASETADLIIKNTSPARIGANDIVMISDCGMLGSITRAVFAVTASTAGVLSHAASAAVTDGMGNQISPGNATNDLTYAFNDFGEMVPYQTVIYYLRASSDGSGTSLWRRIGPQIPQELVQGVDNMQVLYRSEGEPDFKTADNVGNWNKVVSVSIALLVKSLSEYGTDRDKADYTVLDQIVKSPGDRHMRQVFTTTITLRNVAS